MMQTVKCLERYSQNFVQFQSELKKNKLLEIEESRVPQLATTMVGGVSDVQCAL